MQGSQDTYSSLRKERCCTTATTVNIASLIANVGEIFTGAMGWAGEVGTAVADNPLLLMFVIIPFVGLGIGIFRRLMHL